MLKKQISNLISLHDLIKIKKHVMSLSYQAARSIFLVIGEIFVFNIFMFDKKEKLQG